MPPEAARFRYAADPLFLAALAAYLLNREELKPRFGRHSPFLHGHFNDLLLVPVALPVFLWVYRRLGLRRGDGPPTFLEVAAHTLLWALFFEWLGPVRLHHGTGDWKDALCYAAGGLAAWAWWQGMARWRGAKG